MRKTKINIPVLPMSAWVIFLPTLKFSPTYFESLFRSFILLYWRMCWYTASSQTFKNIQSCVMAGKISKQDRKILNILNKICLKKFVVESAWQVSGKSCLEMKKQLVPLSSAASDWRIYVLSSLRLSMCHFDSLEWLMVALKSCTSEVSHDCGLLCPVLNYLIFLPQLYMECTGRP